MCEISGSWREEKRGSWIKRRQIYFFPAIPVCCAVTRFLQAVALATVWNYTPPQRRLSTDCQWLATDLGWFRLSAFAGRTATFAAGACPWTTTPLKLHSPHQRQASGLGSLFRLSRSGSARTGTGELWLFAKVSFLGRAGLIFSPYKSWDQSPPSLRQSDHILSPLFRNQTQLARRCLERRWA